LLLFLFNYICYIDCFFNGELIDDDNLVLGWSGQVRGHPEGFPSVIGGGRCPGAGQGLGTDVLWILHAGSGQVWSLWGLQNLLQYGYWRGESIASCLYALNWLVPLDSALVSAKVVVEMTYTMSGRTLNPTHSLAHLCICELCREDYSGVCNGVQTKLFILVFTVSLRFCAMQK